MNRNPFFEKLTIQQQQLLCFMERYNIFFDSHALCIFSQSRFVMGQLLIGIKPSNTNNKNTLKKIFEQFLKRCSMKFGLYLSPQFIIRGRSNQINSRDVIRFQSTTLLQDQFLALSNYGTATLLGNTSAIAEISYRLSKTPMYNEDGLIYAHGMSKVILLVEYGISRKCPDCLGLMAYFHSTTIAYNSDQRNVLKIAGQSAEAGSIYGWFALAHLLKDNSDHASYHKEFDDELDIYEDDFGVRQFVGERATRDEQICQTLEEHGCENCFDQFYYGKDECRDCGFEFDVFNNYPDDDDTSVPKPEQMRISVEIYYKILSENPSSHPICIDTRKNLVKIYKARERLFNGSIEATDEEIHRLEAI
jgi:hypothetical protein